MGHRRWLIAFLQTLSQSNPFLSKTHQSGWIIYIKKWPTILKWAMYFLYLLVFLWFNSFEVTFNLKPSEFRNILELGLNYNGSTQRKINFMVIIQGDNLYFSSEIKRILVRSAWVWVEGTYLNWYSKQLLVCYDSSSCI